MILDSIKVYPSGKCVKFQTTKKGGWFSDDVVFEVKVYTTIPRQKVPTDEEALRNISEKIKEKKDNWNTAQKNKEGYTHRTNLTDYKGLIILIKENK